MVNELDVGAFYSKQTDRDLAALKALEGHSVKCFQIFITIGDQEGGCFSKDSAVILKHIREKQ